MTEDFGDEYEMIHSDEVDRVVAAIESLLPSIESETIRSYLEDCSNSIYYLVYEDDEEAESQAA